MFKVDETEIAGVQQPETVLSERESKVVSKIVNEETTAIICSMSASGLFVSPMFLMQA